MDAQEEAALLRLERRLRQLTDAPSTFRVTSVPVRSGPAPALMPRYLYEPTILMVFTGAQSSERYGSGGQDHFFAFPDTAIRNEADLA